MCIRDRYNRYVEVAARVKALRFEIRQIQENETRRRIEALMAAQSEAAIKKLMGKKKLSFNEFKILKEKGLI